jgi:hypothetical protein
MEYANEFILQILCDLAKKSDRVIITERADWDSFNLNLTVHDICDAIVDWIDQGKKVIQDVTRKVPEHAGKQIFIFEPITINKRRCYVKVTIADEQLCLVIVSAHEYRERER